MGSVVDLIAKNSALHDDETKLISCFSACRWYHFEEVISYKKTFGDHFKFSDITTILESKFEKAFERPISALADRRGQCEKVGDKIGAQIAKGMCACMFH